VNITYSLLILQRDSVCCFQNNSLHVSGLHCWKCAADTYVIASSRSASISSQCIFVPFLPQIYFTNFSTI